MAVLITKENLNTPVARRIVAFVTEGRVYVLQRGQKNGYQFAPLIHDQDYKYKGKNIQACLKAALQNGEEVLVHENTEAFFKEVG